MPFNDRYAAEFKSLNLEWLENYKFFGPVDLKYRNKPWQVAIERGGRILMAVIGDFVVGTCAIIVVAEL